MYGYCILGSHLNIMLSHLPDLGFEQECNGAISDMKYSPNNSYLAVASHDTFIDIFSVAKVIFDTPKFLQILFSVALQVTSKPKQYVIILSSL